MKILISLSILLSSLNLMADQCAFITNKQAKKAVNALVASKNITGGVLSLCQPCGQTEVKQYQVEQIQKVKNGEFTEVSINGTPVDLAYIYVKLNTTDKKWVNLAKVAKCPYEDVSEYIHQETRSDSSVIFTPSEIVKQ